MFGALTSQVTVAELPTVVYVFTAVIDKSLPCHEKHAGVHVSLPTVQPLIGTLILTAMGNVVCRTDDTRLVAIYG